MAGEDVEGLHERLLSDDDALEQLRQNPRALLREHGIEISEAEHERLQTTLAGSDSATVRERIRTVGLRAML